MRSFSLSAIGILCCWITAAHAQVGPVDQQPANTIYAKGGQSLNSLVAGLGSSTRTLVMASLLPPLSGDLTVPSNVGLSFIGEGQISCGSFTLTIQSSTANWPERQIFANDCDNGLVFAGNAVVSRIEPQWLPSRIIPASILAAKVAYQQQTVKTENITPPTAWSAAWTGASFTVRGPSGPPILPGAYSVDPAWSVKSLIPTLGANKIYYVDGATGSDGNSGLTYVLPLKNLHTAVAKADVGWIYIKGGVASPQVYLRTGVTGVGTNFQGVTLTKNLAVVGIDNVVINTQEPNLTYANNVSLCGGGSSPCPHIWTTTRSSVVNVIDPRLTDDSGDYRILTNVASVQAVEDTAGTWFQSGSALYVRLHDDATPAGYPTSATGLKVCVAGPNLYATGAITVYLENLNFECGPEPILLEATAGPNVPTLAMRNVTLKYSSSNNGLTAKGAKTYCENCIAARNFKDGFNYHEYNGAEAFFFELNSIGRNNGRDAAGNNNASTSHDGATGVRINTVGYGSDGPNIIDVNTGTKTWNLGVIAFNSAIVSKGDFEIQDASDFWCDGCSYNGSTSTYNLVTGATSTMWLRNTKPDGNLFNVGTLAPY